jgi:flagellar biosynthesis anti-sigma factor FlgM
VELSKVSAELKKIPDVREDLVEGFRKQIQEGTYAPDLEKVARSLIVAGLLNGEE